MNNLQQSRDGIAIIGFGGCIPDARKPRNSVGKSSREKKCIARFSDEQLAANGQSECDKRSMQC
jgi:hypothetical protein